MPALRYALCLVSSLFLTGLCSAQTGHSARAMTVNVPFPAGGAIDVACRTLFDDMAQALGQPFVTLNRPGASGTIGTSQVVRSPADGHTLLLGAAPNTAISTYMYRNLDHDVSRDLQPIAQFAEATNVIYVHPSFPATDFASLLQAVRDSREPMAYASPGSGTTVHLAMELIRNAAGVRMLHVPFRGSPAAVTAVASDQVKLGIDAIGPVLPLLQAGKLKAIAVSGGQRLPELPDVPTFAEAGITVELPASYLGLFAPAGTPPEIVSRLAEQVRSSTAKPDVVRRLQQLGFEAAYRDTDDFNRQLAVDRPIWKHAVEVSGATVDG